MDFFLSPQISSLHPSPPGEGLGVRLKYAGANRPLWIIRNGQTEVEEIKATKTAIGGLTEDDQHFDTHEIKLQEDLIKCFNPLNQLNPGKVFPQRSFVGCCRKDI